MDSLTPEQIKALADLAKIADVDPTLAKIVGALASLGGVVITILVHINNLRTKKNTEANEATAKILKEAEERFNQGADDRLGKFESLVEDFRASVETAREQFAEESRQYKLRVMELKSQADDVRAGLSMIPKIQDQLKEVGKQNIDTLVRVERYKEEHEQFVQWMRDQAAKRRGGT